MVMSAPLSAAPAEPVTLKSISRFASGTPERSVAVATALHPAARHRLPAGPAAFSRNPTCNLPSAAGRMLTATAPAPALLGAPVAGGATRIGSTMTDRVGVGCVVVVELCVPAWPELLHAAATIDATTSTESISRRQRVGMTLHPTRGRHRTGMQRRSGAHAGPSDGVGVYVCRLAAAVTMGRLSGKPPADP